MKRITSSLLALLLALSMLIGMVPAAYAAPADTIESIDSTETVDSSETEDVSDESKEVAVHAAGETAETEYVAFSGSTYWTTLQEAINEGPYNIYLAKDVTETVTIPAGKTVNVSLYGHQLHGSITNNGNLTIDTYKQYYSHPDIGGGDATITNEGTLKLACDGATGFVVNNSGALNITGGATYKVSNITNTGSGVIEITSGTFDEAPDSSWLRAGYKATLKSGTYIVSAMTNTEAAAAGFVAVSSMTPKHFYTTLQDAITNNSSTVNVIADVEEDCEKTNGDIILFFVSPSKFTGSLKASGDIKITNGPAVLNNVECNSFTAKKGSWKNTTDITIKDGKVNNITVEESSTDYGVTVAITGGTYTGTVSETTEDTLTISGGKFTADVTNYLAKGATYDAETGVVTPGTTDVAKVGETPYATLGAAFNALSSTDYTLTLLDESAWDTATPVYWEAGTQSGYVAKLTDALTAAYMANAGDIKIVCRPDADVGTLTHGHVADNITIYGNNAHISGGEYDLEVDTYKFSRETGAQANDGESLTKDITITAYELDNLGVWGERHTAHTVNVNLTDCDGKAIEGKANVQRVYISGTSGVNNITLTGCDFMTNNTSVYSNADGVISINNCSFTGSTVPVNFNHKADGSQTLNVEGCSFKNCGDDGNWNQFAAPVRFVNSGSGTQSATVDTCTFEGTVGSNGDILLGDGRTGQESNEVSLTVMNTDAEIQAQKPGYYNGEATDESKLGTKTAAANETVTTTVEQLVQKELTAYVTVNNGTEKYETLDAAIAAAEPVSRKITYTIYGKTEVSSTGSAWIQVLKDGLKNVTTVAFVGATADAEISLTNPTSVLADLNYDINVTFTELTLSHPNGQWIDDQAHATEYFATVLRNTNASGNTVTYTNCTFPDGACNNLYGKTVFDNCQFTNTTKGKYNLWNNGGKSTTVKNCTFTGARGIKTYNEGKLETPPTVKIENTTFNGLTDNKAAVVASKATDITFTNVTTENCTNGLIQKDIEGSTGNEKVTVIPDGTGVSGTFNVNAEKGVDPADDEFNLTAGTFKEEVSTDYLADGFSLESNEDGDYDVKRIPVATINGTPYNGTLAETIKAAAEGDTITLLKNVTLSSALTISKAFTLDLSGFTLDSTAYRTIQLNSGANLTVQDSVGNGKIANSYNGGSYPSTVYLNAKDTVFTLVSGTIESDPYKTSLQSVAINSLKDKACTVNIQGGSVVVPAAAKEGRAIVASTNSMTLNISDGKIAGGLHGIDAYSGSTVNITGGKVTATYVDTGVIKEAYGMRIIGTANVTINGGEIQGIKMDDDGYKLNVPNVTLVSGKVNGSFYSISTGTIVFTVEPTATITFEKDTVKNFLPSTVELVQNTDGTYGVKKGSYVAEINGKQYASLSDAIAAAKDGAEIRLLSDVTENGMDIEKSFTLDFNTHTLTVEDPMVGSTGTKTNAIRFLKNGDTTNTVVLKNGSIKSSKARILIQNYANLTVDNMVLDLSEQPLYGYVLSNNNGVTVINNSKISAPTAAGSLAFDACAFSTYGDVSVTLRGNSVINGDVGFSRDGNGTQNASLTLESGKINGNLVDVGKGETVTVTKSNDVTLDAPTGYKWVDGTLTKITYVAEVNGTTFETLVDAIAAAKDNDTVTLLADTTEDVVISKNITLDLNGFTLTNTEGKHTIVNNGTLTIKDSSTAQTGTVDNVTHGCGALVNNGTVILSGGTFERSAEKGTLEPYGNGGNSWYTIANYGTMTINNGTTVKNAGGYSSNIRNGGQDSTAKLTINGGTFDGGVNTVKNDANGVLEIKGGELKNTAQYVIMNWNQATISGGTFETAETAGAVLFSSAYGTDGTACGELTITGGTFTAAGSKLIDDAYDANNHGTVKISGGSFNRAVDPKHCDTGFIPTQNGDGTYGVKEGTYVAETGGVYYESLQAAIDAASRKGTVKLLADTRENVTISTPYLTLDLNGHTLNGGTEKGKPALIVTARVTVKDGSEAQTGTIMREDTAENSGVSSHYVIDIQGDGWLTFESGNVKNGSGVVGVKGASLVRVGDDSVAKDPGLNIKGGTFTQDNFIVIKVDRGSLFLNGGTLNSANSYAIEDWHRATIKGGTVNGAVAAWTYSGGFNSDLTISDGTINGDVTSVNYGNAEGKTAKVSITGGTINGKLDTRSYDPATSKLTSIDDATKATIEVTGGTFNNDPTKYVVENSKVTNNADGTFGVEKAYLAKVGDTSYYTMDEAFKAQTASGEPIVLLRDYTTGSTFNSGSIKRTVDLGDHTWTYTGTDVNSAAFEINYPDATLTVKNGKVVSKTMLGLIPSAMGGTITYDNAGLVFEGIDATVNGHSGIETNGNNTNDSVTLRNSTLNVPDGFGIYFPSSGTLTIENSKINAKTMGVQVCAGSLKISGADTAITVTGDAVPKTENDGAIQDGAAISIVNRTGYKGLGTITVTGGTFTAKTGNAAIKAYNWANNTETDFTEPTKVEVSGGTFSAEVPADLCAPGYVPTGKDASTGMYTVQEVSGNAYYVDDSGKPVYGDFAALVASTNAATKGKTITLLKNVKIEDNLVLFGNRTVDLNGNVLEITEIFIGLYGKVIDSSDGNGLLKIAADNVTLQSDNGLLLIYDSAKGGYRLFSFTMREQVTKPSDTTVKFKFGPIFENKEAYKLLLTGNNHNIKVTVTLKWISGDGRTGEQTFTFPQNLINGIGAAEGGSGFVINLTGFDSDITGSVSNVTAQWAISSGTGASVSGTPSVIYE